MGKHVVFLRKRAPDEAHAGVSWLSLRPVTTVDGEVVVDEYFATPPEMILGELRRVNGQYGAEDLDVVAGPDKTMAPAVAAIVSRSADASRMFEPRTAPTPATSLFVGPSVRSLDEFTVRKEGTIVAIGVATFARVRNGKLEHSGRSRKTRPKSCGHCVGCATCWPRYSISRDQYR